MSDILHPTIVTAMLIAAFWMGYLIGCGVKLALRAARHDLADDERRRAQHYSAAPWARDIVSRIAKEAGIE